MRHPPDLDACAREWDVLLPAALAALAERQLAIADSGAGGGSGNPSGGQARSRNRSITAPTHGTRVLHLLL